MKVFYPKGYKILCPGCDDHIANVKKDANYGEVMDDELFEWKNQTLVRGDEMACKKCGYHWGLDFGTKQGRFKEVMQ